MMGTACEEDTTHKRGYPVDLHSWTNQYRPTSKDLHPSAL